MEKQKYNKNNVAFNIAPAYQINKLQQMSKKLISSTLKSALIIPDIHAPYEHKATLDIAKQIARDINPDYVVLLGDCFDAHAISKHTLKSLELGIFDVAKEIKYFRDNIYKPLSEAARNAKFKWCGGNHDMQRIKEARERLNEMGKGDFIEVIDDKLDLKKLFPKVEIVEYNQFIKIGKMMYTHGEYCNDAHAKSHVTSFGGNITYGHTHTYQIYTSVTRKQGHPHIGRSLGCACELNPAYMKNKSSKWVNMLAVDYFFPNGNFVTNDIIVTDKKAVFNGKIYTSKQ